MYRPIITISLGIALIQLPKLSSDKKNPMPASAREVSGKVRKYDEMLPKCSPDGRWLAFEYHESSDPNYPRVGIMDLRQKSHPWHTLLESKPGRHQYVGDLSWSPDSQWLAVWTDYPEGRKGFWSSSDIRIAKVNIRTQEVVKLTDALPEGARVGPTTAWLRRGMIVFSGLVDENIYGVPEIGGKPQTLVAVPKERCGGGTNTLGISPDEQRIAFAMEAGREEQTAECDALWIADLSTGNLKRVPTADVHPLSPVWLDNESILFSGRRENKPVGIYKLSLVTGNLTRILEGQFLTPSVCDYSKMLYFSWGPKLEAVTSSSDALPTFNDFYGFRIWKIPLADILWSYEDTKGDNSR